jgi:hypothetical protein
MRGTCRPNANGELRNVYKNWLKNLKKGDHFEKLEEDEGIITKWSLKK